MGSWVHIRCSFHIFSCAKIENRFLEVRLGVMGIGETYFSCGRDQLPHLIRVVMYKTLFVCWRGRDFNSLCFLLWSSCWVAADLLSLSKSWSWCVSSSCLVRLLQQPWCWGVLAHAFVSLVYLMAGNWGSLVGTKLEASFYFIFFYFSIFMVFCANGLIHDSWTYIFNIFYKNKYFV